MKFHPLASEINDTEALAAEYKAAREIGKVRMGTDRLFCRVGRKVYYIPYADVRRYFRRVQEVNVKMCCCGGELAIENLVICGENDAELLQVQLPGTKAAKILIDELKEKMPNAVYGKPVAAE